MVNWSLHSFMIAFMLVQQEGQHASRMDKSSSPSGPDLARLKANHEAIAETFRAMQIGEGILGDIATRLRGALPCTYGDLAHHFRSLEEAVRHAVETERFYHYPRDKGLMVLQVCGDWAVTMRAFPSAEEDVKAAVDCYALGHNNASVHHSMMVLERGLPALAKRLKVRFNPSKATWADLTKGIRDKIVAERALLASPPRGSQPMTRAVAARKSDFLEACEEAALEFKFFTTVWRNHIAHGRGDYDENDAKKVLEHVRQFMEIIATKLKLKG